MAESLYLNNILVDLEEKPITRAIRIGDIGDISSRKSSYSYTVILPKTSKNVLFLDMLATIGNISRKPYENITCRYVVDGITLIQNGSAIVKDAGESYKVNIIDGVKALSDVLAGKKLSDLALTALQHNLTAQSLVDSFSNTEGFIYGIADFGKGVSYSTRSTLSIGSIPLTTTDHSAPLEVNTNDSGGGAIDVVSSVGVTNESNAFYKVLIPTEGMDIDVTAVIVVDFTVNNSEIEVLLKQFRAAAEIDSRTIGSATGDLGDTEAINAFESESFTDVEEDDYFIVSVEIVTGSYETTEYYFVGVGVNASTYFKAETQVPSIFMHTLFDAIFTENSIEYEGDFFTTNAKFLNEVVTLSKGYTISAVGQAVDPSDYLSDLPQIDLVRDVLNRYGLVLLPLQETGSYKFMPLEDILTDTDNAEDWTDKLSKITSESYTSGYAKENKATFDYADGIVFKEYDGILEVDNENAENEKPLFSSPFEIPNSASSLEGIPTFLIPLWQLNNDGDYDNAESPIKVMSIRLEDVDLSVKMLGNATVVSVTTDVPYLSLNDISLQDSIDDNYPAFKTAIDDYKKVVGIFNLSVIDIYYLDFSKLKFLKQKGRFYYLNLVQHTAQKMSKVELIEV